MILDKIVEDKKIRLKEHKARLSFEDVRRMAENELKEGSRPEGLFYDNLGKDGI